MCSVFFEHMVVLKNLFIEMHLFLQNIQDLTRPNTQENIVTVKSYGSYKTRLVSFILKDEEWSESAGKT